MVLSWHTPRAIRQDPDDLYAQLRHWLVNEHGRIVAAVSEPAPNKPGDSFDVRLFYTTIDDTAYFTTLELAKAWTEKRAIADQKKALELLADQVGEGVVAEPAKKE